MNNKKFWLRVVYIIILAGLTLCYIFGDVIQSWQSWFSGLAYAVAVSEIAFTFDKRRKKSMSNKIFWRRLFYGFILVTLTLCYVFDKAFIWSSWTSGLAYGLALSGLFGTFDSWRYK